MATDETLHSDPNFSPDATVASRPGDVPTFSDELPFAEFGNYEILGEIARGGVGVVYRAKQRGLDRIVALKVLQGGTTASPEQIQRFLQEAKSAAKLQHPNIVPIHDYGSRDGQHFFTMDFIEGHSLADRLVKGPIPTREALEIVRQVSDALFYAHEHGVVHRDIKPGNILLDKNGGVKVTDFGLAKELNRDEMHLTVTGQVMGTPRYMSPEQASGKTADADQRSDIFSLGVTMYEMLTGQSAFEADNVMQMLHKVCHEDPPPPNKVNSKVHRDAATICMKAMEKVPAERYPTSQEMTQDIEHFLAGEPIEAKAAGVVRRAFRKVKRYSKVIAVNIAVVAFVIYLLVFYLNSRPSLLELRVPSKDFDVALDGNAIAPDQLGTQLKIKAGKHHVLVAAEPNYDPQEVDFVTEPAESRVLSVGLERRKGVIVVNANPPDAGITILGPDGYRAPLRGPHIEQQLPTGPYAVVVHREKYLSHDIDVNVATRATNILNISLPPIDVWSVPTSATVESVPVVSDLNGDGLADVVVGNDAGNVYCVAGRSGVTRWVHQVGDPVQAPLAVSRATAQHAATVFVGTTGGKLYCLSGADGHEIWRAPFEANAAILGSILLLDVDGDGIQDAIFAGANGQVHAVSGADGIEFWNSSIKGHVESAVALARIGSADVVLVGSENKTVSCFSVKKGDPLWSVDVGAPVLFPPRFEQIDGQPAVLFLTPKEAGDLITMTAISLTDHKILGISDKFPWSVDLNGDGHLEKIVASKTGTTCYASDGTNVLWKSDLSAIGAYTADMDGDGVLDLVFNNGADEIVAVSGKDGSLIGRIGLDSATGRGFTLDDVDRDGIPDVIVGVSQYLHCFSLKASRKLWFVHENGFFDVPFVAVGDRFLTKNNAGDIACYDPQHSDPVWVAPTSRQPSPYVGVAAGQGIVIDADVSTRLVRAFSATNGAVLWKMRVPTPGDVIGAPAMGEGIVVVSDGVAGVYAFALTNGETRWSIALSNITTAAAIGGDNVIFCGRTDTNYTMYCYSAGKGEFRWQAGFTDSIPATPLLVDINGDGVPDVIALCDNGLTYALDGKDGTVRWKFQHSDSRIRTRNGVVALDLPGDKIPAGVLATAQGDVICLDLKTGAAKWTYHLKEPIMGLSEVADMNGDDIPDVLVGTMKGRVHCLSGKGDGELWGYDVSSPLRYTAPLVVKNPKPGAPLVIVGTGPPENGLYCLRGDCPRLKDRGWSGPWKEVAGYNYPAK